MRPRKELNTRFQGYVARQRQRRILGVSMFVVCVLVGTGLAFAKIAPDSGAIASLTNSLASTRSQLAAASSLPWLDGIGDAFYRTVCPLFKSCPEETPAPIPQPQQPARLITTPPVATTSPRETEPARAAPSQPIQQTVINQPVIERIRETVRTVVESGLSPADLDGKLAALDAKLSNQISAVNTSAATNATTITNVYETLGAVARIETLNDVNITNSRWSGGSIEGTSITGTISNAISSALATITDLTSTTITATNATTTNLYVSGETKLGSATGVLTSTSGVVTPLTNGANGLVLKIVAGVPSWATDISGGGGGLSAWATTTDDLAVYPSDTADVLLLGNNATTTTGNILEVAGNSLFRGALTAYGLLSAPRFTATSSQASQFPYASSTALTVSGTGYFGTASTTNLTISGASGGLLKTSSAGVVSVASLGSDYLSSVSSIEDLSDVAAITENFGDLFAWNGSAWADIATSTLAIALSDTTGTLGATRGGTGLSSVSAAGILLGNYAGTGWQQLATSTLGLLTTNVAEGGNLYYTNARVQTYLDAIDKGFFFSTTSAAYFASQNQDASFSTTSATYFAHSSTTIPKTYTSNIFTGSNTFSGDSLFSHATTTSLFVNSPLFNTAAFGATATSTFSSTGALTLAGGLTLSGNPNGPLHSNNGLIAATTSIGVLYGGTGLTSAPTYGQMLVGNSSGGYTLTATSSLGISGGGSSFAYPFLSDATTTKLTFSGGLLSLASTTIGNGTQTGGLTVSGGATTTGNAYFAGNVGVGTAAPTSKLSVVGNNTIFDLSALTSTNRVHGKISNGTAHMWIGVEGDTAGQFFSGSLAYASIVGSLNVLQLAAGDTVALTIASAGNVGIGTTSPSSEAHLSLGAFTANEGGELAFYPGTSRTATFFIDNYDDTGAQNFRILEGTGGTASAVRAYVQKGVNGWQTPSDLRLKTNVQTYDDVLSRLSQFRAVKYDLLDGANNQVGVIAQELLNVFPEVVSGSEQTGYGVNYGPLGSIALQGLNELNLKLEDLATTTPEADEVTFTTRFFSSLFTRITTWLADATNGIQNFFAHVGNFGRVNTDELCTKKSDGTEVCASGDQLAEILSASAAAGTPAQGGSGGVPDGPSASMETNADTTISTTPAAANDNPQPQGAEQSSHDDNQPIAEEENEPQAQEATTEPASEVVAEPVPAQENPLPEPANGNPPPAEELPATGTE